MVEIYFGIVSLLVNYIIMRDNSTCYVMFFKNNYTQIFLEVPYYINLFGSNILQR